MKKIMAICMMVFIAPGAYAGLTGIGIGIHGGIVSGYDNPILKDSLVQQFAAQMVDIDFPDKMTNIGMHVDIGTLRIVEFDGSLDYAWNKHDLAPGVELKFSDISVSGSIKKSYPLSVLKPYAGVGIGIHAMAYELKTPGLPGVVFVDPENETKIGYHIKAGVALNLPVLPLTPFGEWKYNIIQTTDKSTKYHSINLGISLDLP